MHVYTLWYQGKNHAEVTNAPTFSGILGYNAMSTKIEEEAKRILIFFKQLFLKNILRRTRLERTVKRKRVVVRYH